MRRKNHSLNRPRGMVLIIALIFLMLLCILALSSMQSVNMQEKMAGNYKDNQVAFQAAEAALRNGEELVRNNTLIFNGTNGLYDVNYSGSIDWRADSIIWITSASNLKSSSAPRFFIEKLPADYQEPETLVAGEPVSDVELYRITAQGFGTTGLSQVALQSIYKK